MRCFISPVVFKMDIWWKLMDLMETKKKEKKEKKRRNEFAVLISSCPLNAWGTVALYLHRRWINPPCNMNIRIYRMNICGAREREGETKWVASRNQRNWNVEQLDMQSSQFCVFVIRFDLICWAKCAHVRAQTCVCCAVCTYAVKSYHMHEINWCMIAVVWILRARARSHTSKNETDPIIFQACVIALHKAGRKLQWTVFFSYSLWACCCCCQIIASFWFFITRTSNDHMVAWCWLFVLPIWFFLHV